MKTPARRWRAVGAALVAVSLAGAATACSSSSSSDGSSDGGGSYAIWDPYPQFNDDSEWVKLLKSCGTSAGVTVERTGYDTTDLTNKALLAAQQDNSPDVLIIDNPVISTLAEAGALTTTEETKLDTSSMEPNLLGAGQSGGKTYGVPIGANTLALYYNKAVLAAAGPLGRAVVVRACGRANRDRDGDQGGAHRAPPPGGSLHVCPFVVAGRVSGFGGASQSSSEPIRRIGSLNIGPL